MATKFRRWMAVGCTHGAYLDQHAAEAVFRFQAKWKPAIRIHLGDICDLAAFRSGAPGTKDEAVAIAPDVQAGADFILRYRPTDVLIGNHDWRVWKLADHPSALVAHAAACVKEEFRKACEKAKVKRLIDHYDIRRSWIEYGGCVFAHGWMFNEMALRDHAEHFGKCVIAHLHRAGMEHGRRSDGAVAYCTGTLADIDKLEYAAMRRATARWSHGFAWGEVNDTECHINLSESPAGEAQHWHLPL